MFDTGRCDQLIQGLKFELTCQACSEQYDVFDASGQHVAYVRLRHGNLSLSNAHATEDWWTTDCNDRLFSRSRRLKGHGCFEDNEERTFFLTLMANIICEKSYNWIKAP